MDDLKKDELVDVYFEKEEKDGKNWFCGKVVAIGRRGNKKGKAHINFFDGSDNGWYPRYKEMRRCIHEHPQSGGNFHMRCDDIVMMEIIGRDCY